MLPRTSLTHSHTPTLAPALAAPKSSDSGSSPDNAARRHPADPDTPTATPDASSRRLSHVSARSPPPSASTSLLTLPSDVPRTSPTNLTSRISDAHISSPAAVPPSPNWARLSSASLTRMSDSHLSATKWDDSLDDDDSNG